MYYWLVVRKPVVQAPFKSACTHLLEDYTRRETITAWTSGLTKTHTGVYQILSNDDSRHCTLSSPDVNSDDNDVHDGWRHSATAARFKDIDVLPGQISPFACLAGQRVPTARIYFATHSARRARRGSNYVVASQCF